MLDVIDLRRAVRRTDTCFDDDLLSLAESARVIMQAAGIARQEDDAMYDAAVRNYVKGNFDTSAPEAEACREIFDDLKRTMRLSSKYREVETDA